MNNNIEISLLYDFYGQLLNKSQMEVVELCINDDLSLAETSQILGISRQGVRDSLSRAVDKLKAYEEKLNLCSRFAYKQRMLQKIIENTDMIMSRNIDGEILSYVSDIKNTALSLYE